MSAAPAFLTDAVTGWLAGLPPGQFQAWGDAEAPIAPALLGQYHPLAIRFVRGQLRPADRAQLEQAGPSAWTAIMDHLLAVRPADGMVAFAHQGWFFRELAACRDQFLRV